jgi:hypothetical protein
MNFLTQTLFLFIYSFNQVYRKKEELNCDFFSCYCYFPLPSRRRPRSLGSHPLVSVLISFIIPFHSLPPHRHTSCPHKTRIVNSEGGKVSQLNTMLLSIANNSFIQMMEQLNSKFQLRTVQARSKYPVRFMSTVSFVILSIYIMFALQVLQFTIRILVCICKLHLNLGLCFEKKYYESLHFCFYVFPISV